MPLPSDHYTERGHLLTDGLELPSDDIYALGRR
jgi:hypothetical protein